MFFAELPFHPVRERACKVVGREPLCPVRTQAKNFREGGRKAGREAIGHVSAAAPPFNQELDVGTVPRDVVLHDRRVLPALRMQLAVSHQVAGKRLPMWAFVHRPSRHVGTRTSRPATDTRQQTTG